VVSPKSVVHGECVTFALDLVNNSASPCKVVGVVDYLDPGMTLLPKTLVAPTGLSPLVEGQRISFGGSVVLAPGENIAMEFSCLVK
jgi:uncharacterized repeat protein (TIGR01451 family)